MAIDVRVVSDPESPSYQAQARESELWVNVGPKREGFGEAVEDAMRAKRGEPPLGGFVAWAIEGG